MTEARLVQRATGLLKIFNQAGVLQAADVHVALRLQRLGGEPAEPVLLAAALAVRAVRLGSVSVDPRRLDEVGVDENFEVDVDALPWPSPDEVVAALRISPLVCGTDQGPLRPLRLIDTDAGELLYLDRYFRQEQTIRQILDERGTRRPVVEPGRLSAGLALLFGTPGVAADSGLAGATGPSTDRQRIAAALAVTEWTSVIAGGPGTGKTHTVARILSLLFDQLGPSLRVGLAAPTGRAAAQLQASITSQTPELRLPAGLTAMTLHRLLGWQRGSSSRFRHHRANHLPYDVVVVDETSMVSLTLMCRLLEAVRPDARLILVGDPDQLTSVDAGAVLADLVARPVTRPPNALLVDVLGPRPQPHSQPDPDGDSRPGADSAPTPDPGSGPEAALTSGEWTRAGGGIVRLSRGHRFGGEIARLALAVREGRADDVLELMEPGSSAISLHRPDDVAALQADLVTSAAAITAAALVGDVSAALAGLERHRLLCAHREGPYGVRRWTQQALAWIVAGSPHPPAGTATPGVGDWYPGQPLLVTANDYEMKIYNGDTGVVIAQPGTAADGSTAITAAFGSGPDPVLIHPGRLAAVQTVYAMTIHRSQGSQYDTVTVLLPAQESSLLTRELLYTAITRARKHVRVIGTHAAVRAGVERRVLRASGLRRVILDPPDTRTGGA